MDLQTQRLMMAAAGAGKSLPYIDDVFSTFLYEGNQTARSINNGIALASKGGLVWTKRRSGAGNHTLYDTERGATKYIRSNLDNAEGSDSNTLTSFNSNGFSLGTDTTSNDSGTFASWTFRKAPGFFDVVTYTGNGSARTIAHSLGSVPGMILVKQTSSTNEWAVYHKSLDTEQYLMLDQASAALTSGGDYWNDTTATATHFSVGAVPSAGSGAHRVNTNGETYVAYVFAGGESTAATARAVNYVSTANDILVVGSTSDLSFGTGDFTVEGWFREDVTTNMGIFQISGSSDGYTTSDFNNTIALGHNSSGWNPYGNGISGSIPSSNANLNYASGAWIHFAYTRASGTNRIFINGDLLCDWSSSYNYTHTYLGIGTQYSINNRIDGQISNFRVVKGTAVYTSPFKVPTGPLTNITNTVLLCCNNSSVTGSTVGTVTTGGGGGVQPVTDSPFEDSTANVFGENEDQNVIKAGSYIGNGAAAGPVVYLGWEPQFVLVKNADSSSRDWTVWDSMRGIVSDGDDPRLKPNVNEAEGANNAIDLTPTGFKIVTTAANWNQSGNNIIYLAIRRPDGYVGKPPELGTDVFSLGTRSGSSSNALACVNTLVDFSLIKNYGAGEYWAANARLMGKYTLKANTDNAHLTGALPSTNQWDRMLGHMVAGSNGATNSPTGNMVDYGWKRHAGMDVICYEGDGVNGRSITHSMNDVPEMMIVKRRSSTEDWTVYHTGLNGGTNPYTRIITLNSTVAEVDMSSTPEKVWKSTPTATHFEIGSHDRVNTSGQTYLALLFSSIDGISKVGYYSGQATELTITTGFAPRFLFLRRINGADNWWVFDTTRGWASGNNSKLLQLDSSSSESTQNFGAPTSTGFTLVGDSTRTNAAGNDYIYYCHA